MRISRRMALASVPALTAVSAVPALAGIRSSSDVRTAQAVQHLVIHEDECGGTPCFAPIDHPAGDTAWIAGSQVREAALAAAIETHRGNGYTLRRLNAFQTRDGLRYAAVWQWRGTPPVHMRHGLTRNGLKIELARGAGRNLNLAHVDATATSAGPRFGVLWTAAPGAAQTILPHLSAGEFEQRRAALARDGLGVHQLAGYSDAGAPRFVAIFARGETVSDPAIRIHDFAARHRAMKQQGYRLRDASGYVSAEGPFYTAVWEKV